MFTPPGSTLTDRLTELLDEAIMADRAKQSPRTYLGASRWGEECERRLAYEYLHVPSEKPFEGHTLRIFDMGHDGEKRMAEYLRLAGFDLRTEKEDGRQYGFAIAPHPDTGLPRLSGHIDGVILSGPEIPGLLYPCLWENKALNDKSTKETSAQGVRKSKRTYWDQMATYVTYLEGLQGALFTALNRNTGGIYAEWCPPAPQDAQGASDRAVRVISVRTAEELPRITNDPTFYKCKWCAYHERCWTEVASPAIPKSPTWPL